MTSEMEMGCRNTDMQIAGHAHSRIVPFFFVGVLSSLVDIGLMYCCITFLGIWYLYAAAFSYCCGIVVNYTANRYITFHDTRQRTAIQFATFVAISISCLIVNLGFVWLAVTFLALTPLMAKILATCCAFLWNYHGQSRFTFRMLR
jgi:putative flippase GtrA